MLLLFHMNTDQFIDSIFFRLSLVAILITCVVLEFNIHLYFYDRFDYLNRKSAKICTEAEFIAVEGQECRRNAAGAKTKTCEYLRAEYYEKHGECEASIAAIDAEIIREGASNLPLWVDNN